MSDPCTVVIGAPDALATLKERAAEIDGEILSFSDSDALRALETITARKPGVVLFERLFAVTPRGAAMITRIKADRTLAASEIRVVSLDGEHVRVSPRKPAVPLGPPLDQRGTRRAPQDVIYADTAARQMGFLRMVSSRSEPVDTIAVRTPDTSSSFAIYRRAASGRSANDRTPFVGVDHPGIDS